MKIAIDRGELETCMQLIDSITKRLDTARAVNEESVVDRIVSEAQGDASMLHERIFQLWIQKT